MAFLKKDWSYKFEMVYKTFCSVAASKDMKATNKTFCGFLNISTGKLQKWSKGQWPSAEDLETIHDKLGFSYSWLVTGRAILLKRASSRILRRTILRNWRTCAMRSAT